MLKMYQQHLHSGSTPALWEELWSDGSFDESLRFCDVDPLRSLFERYAHQDTLMLEGGCGRGQYVAYYAARGVRVVGLDFASETLSRLRARFPHLMLCDGDVAALPFRDESFDLYYSGGVVEHFESGAEPALHEAQRALRREGVLLISVPYLSPLRRILSPFKAKLWKRVSHAEVDALEERRDRQFFQYIYTPREFEKLLSATGFQVIEKQGYAILWGLCDLPLMQRAMNLWNRQAKDSHSVAEIEQLTKPAVHSVNDKPLAFSLLRRLVINEDDSVAVAGLGVRVLRWTCANMMMYVCRRARIC